MWCLAHGFMFVPFVNVVCVTVVGSAQSQHWYFLIPEMDAIDLLGGHKACNFSAKISHIILQLL